MKVNIVRKTITIPEYLASYLDHVSSYTGYSVSNLIHQSLAEFLYRFQDNHEVTKECWLERLGRCSGLFEETDED